MNKIEQVNLTQGAASCFLPGTNIQYAWDSTSLGLLKQCPRLYQYTMIEGWQSKDENVHLRFGQEYHSVLEDYDRLKTQGADHDEAMFEAIRHLLIRTWEHDKDEETGLIIKGTGHPWETDPDTKAGKYKNRKSLIALVIDYLDKFSEDPAETFILEDGKPGVELSFRFELDWGPKAAKKQIGEGKLGEFIHAETDVRFTVGTVEGDNVKIYETQPYLLSGHLDRVVTFQDSLFVMDRKTATFTLSDYYFVQFEPSNQMTLYSLAAKIVLNAPVKGVIIDAAQIKLEDNHAYVRRFTYRTEGQLEEWVQDLKFWFSQAETYAEANHWPMNDTACSMYGGCRFRDICSKDPGVRENFLKSKFNQLPPEERWNPLKSR